MNVESIFAGFHKLAQLTSLSDEFRRKKEQIRSVSARECGNCDHWMKSTCIPEKKHRQFKSMGSLACGAFTLSPQSKRLSEEFTIELDQIVQKVAAVGKP
jgi:hypothetical protein